MTATTGDLEEVVRGADAVVYAAGSGHGAPGEVVDRLDGSAVTDTADAAVRAGVRRFLVISAHRTDEDFGPPPVQRLLRAKRSADAHVRAADLVFRALVEQAEGARADISVHAAFTRMRTYARDHGQTVATVAQVVVDGSLRAEELEHR